MRRHDCRSRTQCRRAAEKSWTVERTAEKGRMAEVPASVSTSGIAPPLNSRREDVA
jgi:hypothetical protein